MTRKRELPKIVYKPTEDMWSKIDAVAPPEDDHTTVIHDAVRESVEEQEREETKSKRNVDWDLIDDSASLVREFTGSRDQSTSAVNRYKLDPDGPKKVVSLKHAANWWAEKARTNPALFGEFVFGYSAAPHHRSWLSMILDPEHLRTLIVAPRESAKTSWMIIAEAWTIGHFPLTSNFFGSVTATQAQDRLKAIRDLIQFNMRFQMVFPNVAADFKQRWTENEITVCNPRMPYANWRSLVQRYGSPKDPTLFAAGVGSGQVIGRRFSGLCVVDDPHDEANSASPEQRNKLHIWFNRTLVNCVQASGRVIVITTRWDPDDLAGRLIDSGQYVYSETPAIYFVGDTETSYWPEHWPIERLQEKRDEIGTALFRALYLNDPLALTGDVFRIEWLRKDLPEELPEFKEIYLSIDPALKKTASADWTVMMTVGIDKEGNYYILDVVRDKMSPEEIGTNASILYIDIMEKYKHPPIVLIETVAFQEVLMTIITGVGIIPGVSILPVKPHADKMIRARVPAAIAERGQLFIRQGEPWTPILQSEFVSFTHRGKTNDDTVDALSQVVKQAHVETLTKPTLHLVRIPGML